MWTPPHGRGRSREKVLPPPAPLGFEWRVWGSRVTWRRAIGPGGAMTSCSAAAVVEWGGDTHTHSFALARLGHGPAAGPGRSGEGWGGVSGVPWVLGSGRHGSARSRGGGGLEGSRAPARLLSGGGRGPRGLPRIPLR